MLPSVLGNGSLSTPSMGSNGVDCALVHDSKSSLKMTVSTAWAGATPKAERASTPATPAETSVEVRLFMSFLVLWGEFF
jgi:hypothetical protein